MSLKLAHVCLVSPDLDETTRFYCDTLGLKRKFDFIRDGKLFGFYIELDDETFIEIFAGEAPNDDPHPMRHFCLETNDIDAVFTTLLDAGYSPSEKKFGADKSWQIWVKSPEGLQFEFHQYTAESCQHTGAECIVDW